MNVEISAKMEAWVMKFQREAKALPGLLYEESWCWVSSG